MNRSTCVPLRNLSVFALVALVACGGGGGSVGNPPPGTLPTATLTAPADLLFGLTGTVAVTATASDDVGVTGVEFQIDGVTIGAVDTSAPYAVTLDTSLYTSGQHVLRARASDAAGNVSAWSTALVRFEGRVALLATPFATMTVDSSGERGVLGIALHPDFASNGYVYVYSTRTDGGSHNRISRFTAAGDVAAAGSEIALVDLPNLSSKTLHNGGAIHFGSDGKLYVGVGDAGDALAAQDPTSPFGKLLRFNEDGTIPTDNPFYATQSGVARAVWAYGLRNPFTFAVQPGTGKIHINDVGFDTWEEINLGVAGANYGWPISEGLSSLVAGFSFTAPLFTYPHSDPSPLGSGPGGFITGSAIVGGTFYPPNGPFPAGYRDQYYFADFLNQFIGRLDSANGNAVYTFARLSAQPVDLMVAIDGALYVLTRAGIIRISAP